MEWTKSQGIWSILFKVSGNRFILEVSPRFDMSDMDDAPIDLDKINEYQLILFKGPKFETKDDIFLGYYPDRLLATNAGANVFHYMNGNIIRPKFKSNKRLTFVLAALIVGFVLLAWPSQTQKTELNITTVVERTKSSMTPPLIRQKPK